MPVPREGWTAVPDGTRPVSARRRGGEGPSLATVLAADAVPATWPVPATPAPRPRVALVGRLPGVRRRRLLTRAYDITAFGPEEAGDLSTGGFEVVLLDAAVGTRGLGGVLAPLAERHEGARPAVLLMMRDGARLRLRPAYQDVIDDVVAAGLGERQLLARVHSAVRVRGWMSELSRKNAELQGLYGRLEVLAGRMAEELRLASHVQNRMFWDVVPNGLFATLFFAIFDLEEGRLDFVNAGHHHPFVIRADGTLRDLSEGGIVLGLTEDATYEKASVAIGAGDLFVFYSDGVTERADGSGELFGIERLKEAALRVNGDSARIALYSLLGEVQGWSRGAPAEDDVTLVVARAR
jgi:hypothetical protein